jgi:hypothetical protein
VNQYAQSFLVFTFGAGNQIPTELNPQSPKEHLDELFLSKKFVFSQVQWHMPVIQEVEAGGWRFNGSVG